MQFIRRGILKVETDGGPLTFKLNNETILEKSYDNCDYDHNKVRDNIYNYINSEEYNSNLKESGFNHHFKVFVNTTKYNDLDGYNLKTTFKSLDEAKNKINEIKHEIFAFIIYEVYKKDKKIFNIVESKPSYNGLIYLLPKYLREPYENWKRLHNIIIGLKTGKLAQIGSNLYYSIEQYERFDHEAIELLLYKEDMFKGRDQSEYWETINSRYRAEINGESVFYK